MSAIAGAGALAIWDTATGSIPDESRGFLSPSEAAMVPRRDEAPCALAVDSALSRMLLTEALVPSDYLCPLSNWCGGPPDGERENGYQALRVTLGHALAIPTPANFEAVGRAAAALVRLALRDEAMREIAGEEGR